MKTKRPSRPQKHEQVKYITMYKTLNNTLKIKQQLPVCEFKRVTRCFPNIGIRIALTDPSGGEYSED